MRRRTLLGAAAAAPLAGCVGLPSFLREPSAAPGTLATMLDDQGFWCGARPDADLLTNALLAFQKAHGLAPTGTVDGATQTALTRATPYRGKVDTGHALEIDLRHQVAARTRDGVLLVGANASVPPTDTVRLGEREVRSGLPTGRFRLRSSDGLLSFLPPYEVYGQGGLLVDSTATRGVALPTPVLDELNRRELLAPGLLVLVY